MSPDAIFTWRRLGDGFIATSFMFPKPYIAAVLASDLSGWECVATIDGFRAPLTEVEPLTPEMSLDERKATEQAAMREAEDQLFEHFLQRRR